MRKKSQHTETRRKIPEHTKATRCPLSPLLFNAVLEVLSGKINKIYANQRWRSKIAWVYRLYDLMYRKPWILKKNPANKKQKFIKIVG